MRRQVEHLSSESDRLLPSAAYDRHIHVRSSVTITSEFKNDSKEVLVPQNPFTDVAHGSNIASVIATPQSASIWPLTDELNKSSPTPGPAAVSASHNVVVMHSSSSSCGEDKDESVLLDSTAQTLSAPELGVRVPTLPPPFSSCTNTLTE